MVSTIRVEHRERFAVIANAALEDARLSFRARGLLAYLLAKPDGWRVSADRLADTAREGRDAIRTALRELEAAGYLTRSRTQDARGHWHSDAVVREVPTDDGKPAVGSPAVGAPGANASTHSKNYPPNPPQAGGARRAAGTNPRAVAAAEADQTRRATGARQLARRVAAVTAGEHPELDRAMLEARALELIGEHPDASLASLTERVLL